MKVLRINMLLSAILVVSVTSFSQGNSNRALTMQEAFDLAAKNSAQMKISEVNTALARQKTEIAELGRLPGISSSLNYGYLSNSEIWDPKSHEHATAPLPHHLTQFSVQAAEVIFKGGEVTNNIRKATLEEQVAVLSQEKNLEDIKFLVAAKYLDIYRLLIQRTIYVNNAKLAEERLKNVLSLQRQGAVTNNDVLRNKLILSDLELAIRKTDANIEILNQQLNTVLGLSFNDRLIPDSALLATSLRNETISKLMAETYQYNKDLKTAAKEIEIAKTNLKIIEADRLPEVSLFSASNLQRPFLNAAPAVDIYYNVWSAGISIKYGISSIYQSPRKRKAGRIQIEQSVAKQTLQKQNVELAVNAALIKYNEARDELTTYIDDLKSAEENYRIVEKKYFNQLALVTDIIDATNTKIESELKVSNARINVVYNHYQLKKSTGSLQ